MAKIIASATETPVSPPARRMIRLDAADIGAVVAMLQCRFKGKGPNYETLNQSLKESPFYIPETL